MSQTEHRKRGPKPKLGDPCDVSLVIRVPAAVAARLRIVARHNQTTRADYCREAIASAVSESEEASLFQAAR